MFLSSNSSNKKLISFESEKLFDLVILCKGLNKVDFVNAVDFVK